MSDLARLNATGIAKAFGAVSALRGIGLKVLPGEVHALIGENGAGKSTLIKILSGAIEPDAGKMRLDDLDYAPRNPEQALRSGVGTVYQDPQIVPGMSVSENILLGRFPTGPFGAIRRQKMFTQAKTLLESLEVRLDPNALCLDLSVADRQLLQIARAASFETLKLLILDEPTSSLTAREVEHLFGLVERLRAQNVSILFVSHKLDEVMRYCDAVTIFRDGQFIASHPRDACTMGSLVREMVGRDLQSLPPKEVRTRGGTPVITVHQLAGQRFKDISFSVFRGEIFGLFGLVGAGRTDVVRAIFGADPILAGDISLLGAPYRPRRVQDAIRRGLAMVPEDRKAQGLVINLSVLENLTLSTLRSHTHWGVIRHRSQLSVADDYVRRLGIKTSGTTAPVSSLSGGNQQKVVIARWLAAEPAMLMLDEPAAGIDVGAKSDVYDLIERLAASGTSIILVSSELPEILRLCHRIGVMREGRLIGVVDRAEASEERLLAMATVGVAGDTALLFQ